MSHHGNDRENSVSIDNPAEHEALAEALMDPARWPAGGDRRERLDTHISTVILAGEYAYKLKKPVDLGFLNFLDLEARHRYCLEELRLNRRSAPQIYLEVIPISGSIEAPQPGGEGPPIDWAVKMRRFDPHALLSNPQLPLTPELIDSLAQQVASFHARIDTAPGGEFGTPELALAAMQGNFKHLLRHGGHSELLATLQLWTNETFARLRPLLEKRHRDGHIRECHGDLHLGNIALLDGQPLLFDAIEFNPTLRWIDTASDIAFLTMDLHHRGRSDLAYRLLDRYLQQTGDYQALLLLGLYEVYRALVRAKVAAIRQVQPEITPDQRQELEAELLSYLNLAGQRAQASNRGIVITHGVSGSGKSHATRDLPGPLPAIRIRSDIERKRLLQLKPEQSATEVGGYSEQVGRQTYDRLAVLTELICDAGYIAIVDATFLRQEQRERFSKLAEARKLPFLIIDCDAPQEVLRQRIAQRRQKSNNVSDANETVLINQLHSQEPLSREERSHCIRKAADRPLQAELVGEGLALGKKGIMTELSVGGQQFTFTPY